MIAKPLTTDEIREFVLDGLGCMLQAHDGRLYDREDLYSCSWCGVIGSTMEEVDRYNHLCEDCYGDLEEEEEHERQLRSDYLASVL